ncbi:MAG: tRNA-dihydrouridine synthase [Candidatus Campbellbacteria bacterium]|nr:tRNA-dihydrouridine synthase [Candidatus Campbellbacteria bacterium]
MSFWKKLPQPFFCLAPMADVTDPAFRRIIGKYGKLDVLWTEFVSADGLFRGGYDALVHDLEYSEGERPIVAQFFTSTPEYMEKAGALARELGFDGVDINMGCPDDGVCKQGAGAALMKESQLAQELILALKQGAKDIPVSVKTRIGYTTNELETWLPTLLETHIDAITIHARTKKEMSKVPARWDTIAQAVAIRDEFEKESKHETLIIGNGDVVDMNDAREKVITYGPDGVMFGRAIFGNPWLGSDSPRPGLSERLTVLAEHTKLFDELCGKRKSFALMKKHFKSYLQGDGYDKKILLKLMDARTAGEALDVIQKFLK